MIVAQLFAPPVTAVLVANSPNRLWVTAMRGRSFSDPPLLLKPGPIYLPSLVSSRGAAPLSRPQQRYAYPQSRNATCSIAEPGRAWLTNNKFHLHKTGRGLTPFTQEVAYWQKHLHVHGDAPELGAKSATFTRFGTKSCTNTKNEEGAGSAAMATQRAAWSSPGIWRQICP